MKMFKKVAIVSVMMLGMVVSMGSAAMAAMEVEVAAYAGVFDKYLWRGFDLSGSEPVAQGGVDVTAGSFTLSLWSNVQLSDDVAEGLDGGEVNETDITLDYSTDLNDLVSLSVGNVTYAIASADDTNEAYLTVGLNTLLNPSVSVNWDWDQADEDGLFYVLAIGHDFNVSDALTVSLSANAGYNQKNYSVDETYSAWHNAEFGVNADYALSEQLSLSPSFVYSTPLSDDAKDVAGIDDEMAAGLTVNFTF
jgi:uncharacterized protein (TIGR02001 family)